MTDHIQQKGEALQLIGVDDITGSKTLSSKQFVSI